MTPTAESRPNSSPVLEARGVSKSFLGRRRQGLFGPRTTVQALDRVSVDVRSGEILAIVGESGSGKSTLGRCLFGVERPDSGEIVFEGEPIDTLDAAGRRRYRSAVQTVYQDSGSALNPRRTVGQSIMLPLRYGGGQEAPEARERARGLLERVDLSPDAMFDRFPHQLSGGQRQRVGIARALALQPKVVVADEPVSALDVSVRAQVLRVIVELAHDDQVGFAFITHDIGVVSAIADRAVVMRGGQVVEAGEARRVVDEPQEDYTRRLIGAAPQFRSFRSTS